jgi:hypothetical protein
MTLLRTQTGVLASALLVSFVLTFCSRTDKRRADLLANEFHNFQSSALYRELSDLVEKLTSKLESLPSSGPSGAHKGMALSCVRHTKAMFSAMRAKNQKEAAAEALAGHIASSQLLEEGIRAAVHNMSQRQASEAEAFEAAIQASNIAGNLGSLCLKVLTPLAMYSPSGDRMSIFESLARAYPIAPKDTARLALAPLMQRVYEEEDRSSNKSRMRQLLLEAGIPPTLPK